MHPAYSVILFTTASGAGYGLLALLCLVGVSHGEASSLAFGLTAMVMALGLIGLVGFGLYMTSLPFSPQRLKLYNWHKWAGITILTLSALRLLWRLTHPARPDALMADSLCLPRRASPMTD